MNKYLFFLCLLCAELAYSQEFDKYFENKTLRVDYSFAGNSKKQEIFLDELIQTPRWAGRRVNLSRLPLLGNGTIDMIDKETGDTIYRTSFSSLFQEWICENEANITSKTFENSFLLPYPRKESIISISLKDNYHKTVANLTHTINPYDILIRKSGEETSCNQKYLIYNGSYQNCIDIAILAEGYTEKETDIFFKDAEAAATAIFSHEPFKSNKNKFNVVAVATPSIESGVSIPGKGLWKQTAVGSHFNTFYSDRYLTTSKVNTVHELLSSVPYEHIIILANTDTYGGGGIYNSYTLTTSHHKDFKPVVVHEFGHSFGGLADEYAYDNSDIPVYPKDIEPWEQNITTMVNFKSKWEDMINADEEYAKHRKKESETKVGLYEGAGYSNKGIYRGYKDCRMKTNEAPIFCPVCQRALSKLIDFYTKEIH